MFFLALSLGECEDLSSDLNQIYHHFYSFKIFNFTYQPQFPLFPLLSFPSPPPSYPSPHPLLRKRKASHGGQQSLAPQVEAGPSSSTIHHIMPSL